MRRYEINLTVDTFFPIHNIVVVTSPMGDQAPPALAQITIKPANQSLVFLFFTTFCKMVIKTIVAVRLSIIADKINAKKAKIYRRPFLLVVLIKLLIVKKPLK